MLPNDPKSRLPVELSSSELQELVKELDYLEASWNALKVRARAFEDNYAVISSDTVQQSFWTRLHGKGFKDKQLPLDWTRLVNSQGSATSLSQLTTWLKQQFYENGLLYDDVNARVNPIRTDLLGGSVVNYDVRFVHEFQRRVDLVDGNLDASEADLAKLFARYNAEFPESQLAFQPIHKRDVHPLNLSPEGVKKLVDDIDALNASISQLKGKESSFQQRLARFNHTFRRIAIAAGDQALAEKVAHLDGTLRDIARSQGDSALGRQLEAIHSSDTLLLPPKEGSLKNRELSMKVAAAVSVSLPDFNDYAVPVRSKLELLAGLRSCAMHEPYRITAADLDDKAGIVAWRSAMADSIESNHAQLDQICKLALNDGPEIAWDAAAHSFTGDKPAPLDRTGEPEDDQKWDQQLSDTAREIFAALRHVDAEALGSGHPADVLEAFAKNWNFQAMPSQWRHELYRRVFSDTGPFFPEAFPESNSDPERFLSFTVGPDLQLYGVCKVYSPTRHPTVSNEWSVPCDITIKDGVVQRVTLAVSVQLNDSKKRGATLSVISFRTGKALTAVPCAITENIVEGKDWVVYYPTLVKWPRTDREYFEVAKDAASHGMTLFVSCNDPDYRVTSARVVVKYVPTQASETRPSRQILNRDTPQ